MSEEQTNKNSRILVLGATGRTGLALTETLLERGYLVTALVRSPQKIAHLKDKLTIISGDVMNKQDVEKAIKGCDAVISVLGHSKGTPPRMQSIAIKHVIKQMEQQGITRIITLTGSGVTWENDKPSFFDKVLTRIIKTMAPDRFEDGKQHVQEVIDANLSWTVVRAHFLTNGKSNVQYQTGNLGDKNLNFRISRKDLAKFIVDELETGEFIHKMPVVTS